MRCSNRSILGLRVGLMAGAGLAAIVAMPAAAQDIAEDEDMPSADAAGDGESNMITVTARRREERLIDVPISVSSFSGQQLEERGAIDITDISNYTPNVTLEASRATNSTLSAFIRGIGQQDPVSGFEQGVGIYLDDVYLNRPQAAVLEIYDVERIEVLRGPQGTLYGKNTTSGAINITTRQPTFTPEGSLEVSAGSLDFRQVKAALSGPLSETLAARIALSFTDRDGTLYNIASGDNIN